MVGRVVGSGFDREGETDRGHKNNAGKIRAEEGGFDSVCKKKGGVPLKTDFAALGL